MAVSGFLTRSLSKIRVLSGKPTTLFTDAMLVGFIKDAIREVIRELNAVSQRKIFVRATISVVADVREYFLPPNIGELWTFEKRNASDLLEWEIKATGMLDAWGPGFTIEGNILRLDPVWRAAETMTVVYVPNGELEIHEALDGEWTSDDTFLLGTPVHGAIDTRANAYLGSVLRLTDPDYDTAGYDGTVQESIITGYNTLTGALTVTPAFSPELKEDDTHAYEIVPLHWSIWELPVILWVVLFLHDNMGDRTRRASVALQYKNALRTARLSLARFNLREQSQAGGRTR